MKFKIDKNEYKLTSLELYLEKALEKGGVILHKPSFNNINWEEPAIARETEIGDFCVTYMRWLSDSLYPNKEYKKIGIPLKDFTRYIHDHSKISELIDLKNDDLMIEMSFGNNKLTSLTEIEPKDLAIAINAYFGTKFQSEDFKECDPEILSKECIDRELKLNRARKSLLDKKEEMKRMNKNDIISLIKKIAEEECVPPYTLFSSVTSKPGCSSLDELSYVVMDAHNIKTPFMNFLNSKNLRCTRRDIINMFVSYSINYCKVDEV